MLLAVLNDLAAAALRTAGPLTSDTWRCGHCVTHLGFRVLVTHFGWPVVGIIQASHIHKLRHEVVSVEVASLCKLLLDSTPV